MTTNRVGAGPMLNGDPVIATLLNLIAAPDGAGAEVPMDLDAAAWQKLAGDALRNGVAPLVWTRLRELTHSAALPGAARQDLERSRMRVGVDNLRLYGRLATVLSSLETAGIDVIVLKGAFLSEVVYPDRALRSMSDVDLLVHREDLKRTAALLRELGWCQPAGNAAAPPPVAGHQLPTFVLAGVQIEIHWAIEDEESPFRVDTPGLWCRAVPVRIAGASAFGLAPEDLLLHLCLHTAYGHGWLQFSGGLRHLCDIAATIRHYRGRLDWTAFVSRAHSWGIARSAWLALAVARELVRA
ncbi:MAG TPA: nucleotidyltransferase family protein, partial [Burkholderiaceae bacterium]|nr:nucleotidyltransferase family protein [Burkholderiaceae bacterium]